MAVGTDWNQVGLRCNRSGSLGLGDRFKVVYMDKALAVSTVRLAEVESASLAGQPMNPDGLGSEFWIALVDAHVTSARLPLFAALQGGRLPLVQIVGHGLCAGDSACLSRPYDPLIHLLSLTPSGSLVQCS